MILKYFLSITLMLFLSAALAQSKTEKFSVKGSCDMCKNRIEKTAKSIKGVSSANWSKTEQTIEVTFDESKITIGDIHKAIAKVGHDTDKERAKDVIYNRLPTCCKYDRDPIEEPK